MKFTIAAMIHKNNACKNLNMVRYTLSPHFYLEEYKWYKAILKFTSKSLFLHSVGNVNDEQGSMGTEERSGTAAAMRAASVTSECSREDIVPSLRAAVQMKGSMQYFMMSL